MITRRAETPMLARRQDELPKFGPAVGMATELNGAINEWLIGLKCTEISERNEEVRWNGGSGSFSTCKL